ncbi:hypothetical protein BDC45DRAFT_436758 [Circinella umbellata]|nr:hypothetical protein BDC45DRAFT_436758 [Circinella umbellata]
MCALIDSIMNNYYIPPVVFAVRKGASGKVVRVCIDGKQRLTSILRFMRNEIPYPEILNGGSVDKLYCNDGTGNINKGSNNQLYLDDITRDHFDHTEIVCVEYTNLDTDSEIEIFSRVQLGVPLTTAEKLKANGSPISKYCQSIYEQYKEELSTLFVDVRGRVFQYVASIVLLIMSKSNSTVYPCSIQKINSFLSDNELTLTNDIKRTVTHVMNTFVSLINEPSSMVFTHIEGRKAPFRPMEFLAFGLYISKCRRRRQIKEYEADCNQLRFYLYQHAPNGVRMGSPCYKLALQWIDQQMDATGQTPALIQHPAASSTDTSDEVPEEDDEEGDENRIEDALDFYKRANLKRKIVQNESCLKAAEQSDRQSRPVARRGGKFPRTHR